MINFVLFPPLSYKVSYEVLKFAFVADITMFDPDKAYFSQHVLDAICTFSFDERLVMKCQMFQYSLRDQVLELCWYLSQNST